MMITVRAGSGAIAACLLLLMAGCSREQQDWRSAETADTIESYGQFIQRHPDSELATQARTRVAQLGEDRDWQHAGSADTLAAYREFLVQHPNGKWAQEAHIRIDNFSLGEAATSAAPSAAHGGVSSPAESAAARRAAQATQVAQASQASQASQVAQAPEVAQAQALPTAQAAPPADPAARAKAFGIQLGAFATEASASSQWHLLSSKYASELGGLQEHVVPADTATGRVYRLQAAVGSEGSARSLCDLLRRRGQACVAVLPR